MNFDRGALTNLTILDLSRVLAGPFCTMLLADMGANVIKIEVPGRGDDSRAYPPFRKNCNGENESLYFANINRNKSGITLNLKTEQGKQLFRQLVQQADVVVENYRPGVMDRLGLGYEDLKKLNPRIIYAGISGFGSYGPYSSRPGYDILAQAMGGMMSITGPAGGAPTRAGSALGDVMGGLYATIGILAAVNARTLTGQGQRIDISLMDGMISATENTAIRYLESGQLVPRNGNRYAAVSPYDSFACKDGQIIVACGNQKLFEILCRKILNMPELIDDPRFTDMTGRLQYQDVLKEAIEGWLADKTMEEATEILLANGLPAGPILDMAQILQDDHVKAREMFVDMQHPTLGEIKVNGCVVKLSDTQAQVRTPAPALGAHNGRVYSDLLGITPQQVQELAAAGVI